MSRLDSLKALLQENDNDPFLLFAIAKEHESLDQDQSALQYFLKLKKNHPNYIGLYYHLAKLYERSEDADNALNIYTLGIKIAKEAGDQHSLAELKNAKLNLEFEL